MAREKKKGEKGGQEDPGGVGAKRVLCHIAILDNPSLLWLEVWRGTVPFKSMNNFFGCLREHIVRRDVNLKKMTTRNLYLSLSSSDLVPIDDIDPENLKSLDDGHCVYVVYFKRRYTPEAYTVALRTIAKIQAVGSGGNDDNDNGGGNGNGADNQAGPKKTGTTGISHPLEANGKASDIFDTPSVTHNLGGTEAQRLDVSGRRFRGALLALSSEDGKEPDASLKQQEMHSSTQNLVGLGPARSETVIGDPSLDEIAETNPTHSPHQISTPSEKAFRTMKITSLYPNRSYAQSLERPRVELDHQSKYYMIDPVSVSSKKPTTEQHGSTHPPPRDDLEPPRKAGVHYAYSTQFSTLSPESPESQSQLHSHSSSTPTPVRQEHDRAKRMPPSRPAIIPALAHPPNDQDTLGSSTPIGTVHLRLPPLPIGLAMRLLQLISDYNRGLVI
ncbi:hypothetical protein GMRT_14932 [Giardia muris]|uniref:Uncharacterized protein n=1 Tax=Giardia muris TaxID=5742 RepID=A0A4Z1SPK3_GIAMU|nr:hypothetical protein GMRT_14932 [Giardia muris]|eukprot:TNJ27726.1 hypothetical protein GMRT_14932 [Giardia muris]